jgi:Arabinose efflux permease
MRWPDRWRPVDTLIGAHGLSSFCLGLAMPYTAIYLADRPGVGTAGVAVFFAFSGGANLAVALLLSTGALKLGRIPLGVLGTLLWLAGYLTVPMVGTLPTAIAAGVAVGAGQGGFMAAIIPLINGLITADERRQVFARRYAVLNATLAGGSLLSGLLTLVLPRTIIPYFFLANAVGILPLTAAIWLVRRHAAGPSASQGDDTAAPPLPVLGLWKVMLPVALFQLTAALFAFSQFDATAPLVSTRLMHMPLFMVSLMLFVDVIVVVIGQRPIDPPPGEAARDGRPARRGHPVGGGLRRRRALRLRADRPAHGGTHPVRRPVRAGRVRLLVLVPPLADLHGARPRTHQGQRDGELHDGRRQVRRPLHRRRSRGHRQRHRRMARTRRELHRADHPDRPADQPEAAPGRPRNRPTHPSLTESEGMSWSNVPCAPRPEPNGSSLSP